MFLLQVRNIAVKNVSDYRIRHFKCDTDQNPDQSPRAVIKTVL